MLIYLLLLIGVVTIQSVYFDEPLSSLWLSDPYPPEELIFGSPWLFEIDVLIGATVGLSFVGLSRWMSGRFAWLERMNNDFASYFRGISSSHLTGLALMSSLVEELIFRGWLQDSWGLVLTSIIFGLVHIPMERHHWPWTVAAMMMGFVFGFLYLSRGSVTAPFVAHFTINYFNLHALVTLEQTSLNRDEQ